MAFPRLSASMMLASLIFLLYWTTSSAQSHAPASSDPSPPYRVKRDLPFETREKVEKSLEVADKLLNAIEKKMEKVKMTDTRKLITVMRGISNIANLAPGIGSLVAATVNMVLVFIPQDDPVLNEVQKGFADVNRKLDSLSTQISNLATDVEWFNYASVYSQDEVRILNAWNKFNELRDNSKLIESDDKRLQLAEIFVNYYENTGTEASVANLYHYLTVRNTSLSRNLNELLKKKFKCDVSVIYDYNIYFSSLLWKGMVLNQFYWKLIGFDLSGKEAEHTQMFKDVYTAQISAVDYCLKNYMEYMEKDVEEISKGLSSEDKTAIAVQVKEALDKKFFWYNWVVMVYNTDEPDNHVFYHMMKIPVGTITVAVGKTQKAEVIYKTQIQDVLQACYKSTIIGGGASARKVAKKCETIENMEECNEYVADVPVRDFVKVMHSSYGMNFDQVPEALKEFDCTHSGYMYQISLYYSRSINPCEVNTCGDGGTCKTLLDSNEHVCECPDGFRRDKCEEDEKPGDVPELDGFTVPDITTINARLKLMEDKLEAILLAINTRCPAQ